MLPIDILNKLCTNLKQIKQLTKESEFDKSFDNDTVCHWLKRVDDINNNVPSTKNKKHITDRIKMIMERDRVEITNNVSSTKNKKHIADRIKRMMERSRRNYYN